MERLNQLVTPTKFSEKLQAKLGNLWSSLDLKEIQENEDENEEQWTAVFDNIRKSLIRAASEPDFPIDFNFGETPFSHYAKLMANVDPEGKLKKLVVRTGIGEKIPPNSAAYVFYKAYLENEEYPFHSSFMQSSSPQRYQLGSGALCEGFEAAIATMEIGEKSHFLLAPELAVGKRDSQPSIPPDSEVLLELELCDIVRHGYATMLAALNPVGKGTDLENVLKTVEELHQLGNEFHRSGNFFCAVINYRKAENFLSIIKCFNEIEEKRRKEMLLKMIVNQIITFVTGNKTVAKPREAVSAAVRAFQHVPAEAALSTKLKYNLAKAYILLNEEEKAFHLLKEATKLDPEDVNIRCLHDRMEKELNDKVENEIRCWKSAQKKFPEHDSKEEYMAFLRNSIKTDLENYIENPQSNIGMPWNYTDDERVTLCRQAENMDLVYEEYKSHPANVLISIHKRGSAMLITERDEILCQTKELISSDEEENEEHGFIGWGDFEMNEVNVVDDEDDVILISEASSTPPAAPGDISAEGPCWKDMVSHNDITTTATSIITINNISTPQSPPTPSPPPAAGTSTPIVNMEDEVFIISDSDEEDETNVLKVVSELPGCSGIMMRQN